MCHGNGPVGLKVPAMQLPKDSAAVYLPSPPHAALLFSWMTGDALQY